MNTLATNDIINKAYTENNKKKWVDVIDKALMNSEMWYEKKINCQTNSAIWKFDKMNG